MLHRLELSQGVVVRWLEVRGSWAEGWGLDGGESMGGKTVGVGSDGVVGVLKWEPRTCNHVACSRRDCSIDWW